ncbi:MAG: formate dehydrogenase family accessory protein FdhD [Caulobacteraceae bacterium]|nr:formate dehydrogenase family accessory protein FdhD [Caulobacteraceae bacterium]
MTEPVHIQPALQWRLGAASPEAITRAVPEETAIGISYDSEPYAVLMATPADVADLALGFTVSERIAAAAEVLDIRVSEHDEGLVADVLLSRAGAASARDRRRRNMEGRSSCGLCGIQSPEDALRALPVLAPGLTVRRQAIQAALTALEGRQTLGAATRATHAAAWADADGRLLLVREDVGRHNALDKLIGAALKAALDPARAFVVVTSRCSYEMVEKTVLAGVSLLVAISAPTALAIRKAQGANLTLIALARADGHAVFAGAERVLDLTQEGAAA